MKTVVIMPGGFHPFHAGHAALYNSARRAFPDAEVYVAATNDTSTRPFPFQIKEKLARLAGVAPGHFVQVKSPFQAREITANLDPENTQLIFVRSQKDADKPPQAGGVKKNGEPSYLQPLTGNEDNLLPMNQRAYMAYLPTVEFGPGMTSATEIRTAWPQLNEKRKTALVMSLYPKTQTNPALAANVVKMLDTAMGTEQGVAEGSKYKCSCHPGDPDPDCPIHGLEPMEVGDSLDVKKGVKEGLNDTIYPNAEVIKSKNGKPVGEIYQDESGWGCFHYKADNGADSIESREEALEWLKDLHDEYRQDRSLEEAGITRRGILKGIGAAAAAGAAGKASAIAGAFPTPSHQAAMYKAAADSNAAQARADAAAKAKADAKRIQQGTQDIERLNQVNYHGKNAPIQTDATWDGDSSFMYLNNIQLNMASRMPIRGDVPSSLKLIVTKEGRQVYIWTRSGLKGVMGYYFYPADNPKTINEFAPDDSGGSRKFIPWTEFIEQVKQIVSKDFSCKENVVKSTIKARFVPHDPMEYGPTMLYSYYETRAGGRNKGAVSTRGSIQVGKYFDKGSYFNSSDPDIQNQLLTSFSLLKGHPFERHFDLTFDNIYKIANIIMSNTEGAYQMQPQQGVAEDYVAEKK